MSLLVQRQGQSLCWFDADIFPQPDARVFSPAYWQQGDRVDGQSHGRGVTWFVHTERHALVLRHYWRGGLVGRWIRDGFVYLGAARSRAMAEFSLLRQLAQAGVAVPRPAAARLVRHGLVYRADILVERIAGARDLVDLLQERPLGAKEWRQVGAAIARLHEAGGYHSDLNSHNLLLDPAGKVWIIDLDKGRLRRPGAWQAANLARLLRSLRKEAARLTPFHWQETDWADLLAGYTVASA